MADPIDLDAIERAPAWLPSEIRALVAECRRLRAERARQETCPDCGARQVLECNCGRCFVDNGFSPY